MVLSRKLLIKLIISMFAIGFGFIAVVFISSLQPSEKAEANYERKTVEVEVGILKVGEYKIVSWDKKPIVILRRNPDIVATLSSINSELNDPDSTIDPDPEFIKKTQRSISPEYFVGFAISTYCGCGLKYGNEFGDFNLPGGLFYDPCHTGVYDIAGRLLKSTMIKPVPACKNERMSNMKIPPYKFIDDTTIVIGNP
jgi:ubiquinol-cytochrome c reductase iron-sulfur subunit